MSKLATKNNNLTSETKDIKELLRTISPYNHESLLRRFEKLVNDHTDGELTDTFWDQYHKVTNALGLDTHTPLADSLPEEYREFVVAIIRDTENEYGCQSAIEKSLAEMIALCHVRIILLNRIFNSYLGEEVEINKDRTNYYTLIGKQLDLTHRQLTSHILTLKQIKAPTTQFKVTAKTAFVAQNQQINSV